MDVKVEIEGDFSKIIGESKKNLEKALPSAFRKASTDIEKEIHGTLVRKKLMDIDFKDFRKTKVFVKKVDLSGGMANMNAQLFIRSISHTSFRFFPKSVGQGRSKVWFGRIYGKAKRFYGKGKVFQIPGKKPLFVREGPARFPVKSVFGPNAVDLLEKTDQVSSIMAFADKAFKQRLGEVLKE